MPFAPDNNNKSLTTKSEKPDKSKPAGKQYRNRSSYAKRISLYRKLHKTAGIYLSAFFFIISLSGILLAWKKDAGELIQANTRTGTSSDFKNWLSTDSLYKSAVQLLQDSVSPDLSPELSRMDIRKDKGIVKVIFENHYYSLQLDGATGKLLNIEYRTADLIEGIHDASALDRFLNTPNEIIKLIYMSVTGIAGILLIITGFLIWYEVKRIRKKIKQQTHTRQNP
jgi:uncharacterized iron-regulated membrane protein